MVIAARHVAGCFLNPLEYLLGDDGDIMRFPDKAAAVAYLKGIGFPDEEIQYMRFLDTDVFQAKADESPLDYEVE